MCDTSASSHCHHGPKASRFDGAGTPVRPICEIRCEKELRFCDQLEEARFAATLIYSLGDDLAKVIRGRMLETYGHASLGYGSKGGLDLSPNGRVDAMEYKNRVYC